MELDNDGDGYTGCDDDCDDGNPDIYPDAEETCDGLDTNCDGHLVFGEGDQDGDGWLFCSGDCNDFDASLTPADLDGDSYSTCQGDCDDSDASVNPSVAEVVDGTDNDCDGGVDLGIAICSFTVPTDYTAIQDAIDASQDGDVVCVLAGTYVENIDFLGKGIEVLGVDGRAVTVIDGNSSGSVVTLVNGEGTDSVLRGFTLTHGLAMDGGGVAIDGASPTLSALAIDENEATGSGGGMYVYQSSTNVSDVSFWGNDAGEDGGGLYVGEATAASVVSLTVTGNSAFHEGGGIHIADSEMTLFDISVSNNVSIRSGGGIYLTGWYSATQLTNAVVYTNESFDPGGGIVVSGTEFLSSTDVYVMGNRASEEGGGIKLSSPRNTFTRLVVSNNTQSLTYGCGGPGISTMMADETLITDALFSDNYHGQGGGLCLFQTYDFQLNNVVFRDNQAGTGGGIRMFNSSITITNGMFVDNRADGDGGAMYIEISSADLSNVIIAGNSADDGGGVTLNAAGLSIISSHVASNSAQYAGGIWYGAFSSLYMANSIVVDNHGATGGGGITGSASNCEFANNNVYNNTPDNYHAPVVDPTGTNGNISVDPQCLDTSSLDPFDWDLHLDPTSPLIDAGDPSILDPDGSLSDIGAFGGQNAEFWDLDWDGYPLWWQPGSYDYATYPDEGWDCDDLDTTVFPGAGC